MKLLHASFFSGKEVYKMPGVWGICMAWSMDYGRPESLLSDHLQEHLPWSYLGEWTLYKEHSWPTAPTTNPLGKWEHSMVTSAHLFLPVPVSNICSGISHCPGKNCLRTGLYIETLPIILLPTSSLRVSDMNHDLRVSPLSLPLLISHKPSPLPAPSYLITPTQSP